MFRGTAITGKIFGKHGFDGLHNNFSLFIQVKKVQIGRGWQKGPTHVNGGRRGEGKGGLFGCTQLLTKTLQPSHEDFFLHGNG